MKNRRNRRFRFETVTKEQMMSKQAYIVTSGAGSDFCLVGIFDSHDEAMAEQGRCPSPYCYGNEVLTVSISHDEYELLRWLINPAGPRPVAGMAVVEEDSDHD